MKLSGSKVEKNCVYHGGVIVLYSCFVVIKMKTAFVEETSTKNHISILYMNCNKVLIDCQVVVKFRKEFHANESKSMGCLFPARNKLIKNCCRKCATQQDGQCLIMNVIEVPEFKIFC